MTEQMNLTEQLKHYFGFDSFKGDQESIIKNLMKQFDSDGDLLNANGVAGMDVTGKGTSWQKLTNFCFCIIYNSLTQITHNAHILSQIFL